jgi:hypothetical protein
MGLKEAGILIQYYQFLKRYFSKFLAPKAKTTSVTTVVVVDMVGGSSVVIGSTVVVVILRVVDWSCRWSFRQEL